VSPLGDEERRACGATHAKRGVEETDASRLGRILDRFTRSDPPMSKPPPTGDDRRKTLNEVLVEEMRVLRPGALDGFVPTPYPASADQETDAWKQKKAANLVAIYATIRELSSSGDTQADRGLSALCFSGGGIRSATFNLGILYGLARNQLLGKFDYLSSVSGGGYIASWLRTWIWREKSVETVQDALRYRRADPLAPEPPQLEHLREYSNYLTPKLGLFSADTWTLAAIVIRNLLLNGILILPLISIIASLPLFMLLLTIDSPMASKVGSGGGAGDCLLVAAYIAAGFASVMTHITRHLVKDRAWLGLVHVSWLSTCLAATLLCLVPIWMRIPDVSQVSHLPLGWSPLAWFVIIWCIAIPTGGWIVGEFANWIHGKFIEKPPRVPSIAGWEFAGIGLSGAIAAYLLYRSIRFVEPVLFDHPAAYTILAFPLLLAIYLVARTLFVAFIREHAPGANAPGFGQEDSDREWWARLSGWILLAGASWLVLSTLCIVGTHALRELVDDPREGATILKYLSGAAGVVAGLTTALLGASSKTVASEASSAKSTGTLWSRLALVAAAPVFATFVFVLVTQLTICVEENVFRVFASPYPRAAIVHALTKEDFLRPIFCSPDRVPINKAWLFWILPGLCAVVIGWFGWFVNVNRFSLHGMYRNRLVRAYLGASTRDRNPDAFTGMDPNDNQPLHRMVSDPGVPRSPIPIINATLNLVQTDRLSWQQRRAESFTMTPLHCGSAGEGYRSSRKFGGPEGISIGTAITISGAAANPNMGSSSSPTIGFLLAFFNLRLGAWLGNTNRNGEKTWKLSGPRWAIKPILAELFGLTSDRRKYVNLSDGGHFENLGLYEVVQRRCRNIVLCDAGHDPTFGFEDLGNAIRKIRIDFGIPIEFDRAIDIQPRDAKKQGVYCAFGWVRYSRVDDRDPKLDGRLVYFKPTLCATGRPVPYDVYSYSQEQSVFPHESTAEQWFSESQFESYRALASHALGEVVGYEPLKDVTELIEKASDYLDASVRQAAPPKPPQPEPAGGYRRSGRDSHRTRQR
jgi:hypothetical protein